MSQLRSVLEEIAATALEDLTVDDLAAEISEVAYGIQTLEVLMTRLVASLTDRGGHHSLGYSSPTYLLCDVARMTPTHARQIVSMAQVEDKAPHAYQAWADGRLSTDQAQPLFRAARHLPDVYPDAEERLVAIVEGLDPIDTHQVVEYWRQSVDGPGLVGLETQMDRRGLSLSRSFGGMRHVDGWMTGAAGEAFEVALEANMPPPREGDNRTPRQRRHDALENLCRDWLDNGTTSQTGGEKPHISLHADPPALQGHAGGLHETEDGAIVDVDMLRMIACDCSLTRIVLGPESEILDVGRKTRVWTSAQRRAIVARDRHCQGPGCQARARHCDIHHLQHWADGGDTSIDNGSLLCRSCHTQQHLEDGKRRRRRQPKGW